MRHAYIISCLLVFLLIHELVMVNYKCSNLVEALRSIHQFSYNVAGEVDGLDRNMGGRTAPPPPPTHNLGSHWRRRYVPLEPLRPPPPPPPTLALVLSPPPSLSPPSPVSSPLSSPPPPPLALALVSPPPPLSPVLPPPPLELAPPFSSSSQPP
ncbi:hypothetical protein R3W88_011028 [Solanum pinnatisectum]|uniref:Uncharacterized protein n=1 Tax=Solanum pinnatisectum TaxID=50273 RepID=A0AAV9L7D7_9SOLN|nr:hypothetical protein R3W88_011028 [Solanum pinnatisectum]